MPDYWMQYAHAEECCCAGIQPADDIQTLEDYRARHALYRRDPGLRVSPVWFCTSGTALCPLAVTSLSSLL